MKTLIVEKLSEAQLQAVVVLQKIAFPDVSDKEAQEDFFHPKSAHVLAFVEQELVGWAGIHEKEIEYTGSKIKLGGYGRAGGGAQAASDNSSSVKPIFSARIF